MGRPRPNGKTLWTLLIPSVAMERGPRVNMGSPPPHTHTLYRLRIRVLQEDPQLCCLRRYRLYSLHHATQRTLPSGQRTLPTLRPATQPTRNRPITDPVPASCDTANPQTHKPETLKPKRGMKFRKAPEAKNLTPQNLNPKRGMELGKPFCSLALGKITVQLPRLSSACILHGGQFSGSFNAAGRKSVT